MEPTTPCAICKRAFVPRYHRGQAVKFCGPECRREHKRRLKLKPEYVARAKEWRALPAVREKERERRRQYKAKRRAKNVRCCVAAEPFTWIG